MLEQALRTFLLSKPAIAAAVCNRIHVGDFAVTKKEQMPMIGIEADPQERQLNIDGVESPMQFPNFDIVVKCLQFSTSITIGQLVAKAFRSIPLGATIFTSAGTCNLVTGQKLVIGIGTIWTSDMVGQAIEFRDAGGNLIASGTVGTVQNSTALTLTTAPSVTRQGLLFDLPSASFAVQISQVDILGQWNDKEEDGGHGFTVKPRVVKIRVGWLEDTSSI